MITYQELRALQLTDKGSVELPDNMDSHADSALAMALAYVCINQVTLKVKPFLPNWIGARQVQRTIASGGAAIGKKQRY
jgi:hypothetical protein